MYPPLALLPRAGLPPFLGDKRSVALRERSDADLAHERRLTAALFTISSTAAPAKELRAAHHEASPGQVVLAVSLLRRAQLSVSRVLDAIGKRLTSAGAAGHLMWLEDHSSTRRPERADARPRRAWTTASS